MSIAGKVTGAEIIDVEFIDGAKSRFEMKRLSVRNLLQWCSHVRDGKSFDLVCLSTGQPAEVVDRLTPQSFGLLVTKAWEENFSRATPVIQADPVLAGEMLPVLRNLQGVASETLQILGAASLQGQSPTELRADAASESLTSTHATSSSPSLNADASMPSASSAFSTP